MGIQRLITCVHEQKLYPATKIKKSRVLSDRAAVISDASPTALPPSPLPTSPLGLLPLLTGSVKKENPKNKHIIISLVGLWSLGERLFSHQSLENRAFHI